MTGEEMERAIEFILQHQATLEEQIAETNRLMQMQATSQSELNQFLTAAITNLAESQQKLAAAQAKTEAKVDRLADVVGQLVERLGP
jgi:peptidoglycan hydrolase CwlO-like protein